MSLLYSSGVLFKPASYCMYPEFVRIDRYERNVLISYICGFNCFHRISSAQFYISDACFLTVIYFRSRSVLFCVLGCGSLQVSTVLANGSCIGVNLCCIQPWEIMKTSTLSMRSSVTTSLNSHDPLALLFN